MSIYDHRVRDAGEWVLYQHKALWRSYNGCLDMVGI
jgi:hypothetical protein